VGAVTRHRDEPSTVLLPPDELELVLRFCLGEEVIHTSFARDGRRGERIVARDHDRSDSHRTQTVEALLHSALYDVLEVYGSKHARRRTIALAHDERGAALACDALDDVTDIARHHTASLRHV